MPHIRVQPIEPRPPATRDTEDVTVLTTLRSIAQESDDRIERAVDGIPAIGDLVGRRLPPSSSVGWTTCSTSSARISSRT